MGCCQKYYEVPEGVSGSSAHPIVVKCVCDYHKGKSMSCCQKYYESPEGVDGRTACHFYEVVEGPDGKTAYQCTGRLFFLPRHEVQTPPIVGKCVCDCHKGTTENDHNKVESNSSRTTLE